MMSFHIIYLFVVVFFILHGPVFSLKNKVDVTQTNVWGNALNADATLPVRYFYIQPFNHKGKPIEVDLGDDAFTIDLSNAKTGRARAWKQVLNLHNGTYIARFRLYNYDEDLLISVKHNGRHVAQSPYLLKKVYGDDCYCPNTFKKWIEAMQCPETFPQLEEDFAQFTEIDLDKLVKEGIERFGKNSAICHYAVKHNKIFRRCPGSITDFKMFVDAPLLSLARKMRLPDIEFIANLGDWPLEKNLNNPLPIVSWCGSKSTADIILPTYDITQSVTEMLGRISLDIFSVQANTGPKWKYKINKGFFRGRDSRRERLFLAETSVKHPDLLDAKITNYFFFDKNETKYGKSVKAVSFYDFFKYKYQINVDGTVAAYRFPYLMLGDSLVMKQDSNYYEHFYKELKPWEHYVPIDLDLMDTKSMIEWAKENDEKAQNIQQAGTKLAREILSPKSIFCYHARFYEKYSKLQNRPVKVLKSMEEVKQPDKVKCNCHRLKKQKDEL